jgi:SAM-dependent methyltransferase
MTTTSTYDDRFFRMFGDEPDESSGQVLRTAFAFLKPDSVVDIGCGTGKWIAMALMLGAREGFGVDGGYVPREQRLIPPDRFIEHDLENFPLALGRKFDMAICLEVAEHLSRRRSASFVAELCGLSNLILFSAAPPFQEGTHHVNEQWLEYWGILFRREQFVPVDVIRDQIWLNGDVQWYYRQNTIFFCRETVAARLFPRGGIVRDNLLTRLHPEMLLASISKFWPFMYGNAYHEETYHYHALAKAWLSGATELPAACHRDSAIVDSRSSLPIAEILRGNGNGENNRVCVEQPLALEFAGGELIIRRA